MGDFGVLNVFFAYVVCLRHEYDLLGLAFYEELILVMSSRRVGGNLFVIGIWRVSWAVRKS